MNLLRYIAIKDKLVELVDGLSWGVGGQALDDRYVAIGTDPDADRIYFWDDSAGAPGFLTPGQGLSISGTTLASQLAPGLVSPYAGSSAPSGWLLCDGSAVSRTTYAALYAVVADTYGAGDGSTTFNVPNLKGRVPVGYDAGQTEFDTLGETGGAKTHTLQTTEIPSHNHTIGPTGQTTAGAGGAVFAHNSIGSVVSGNTGGGGAHNNLQPYLTLQYVIKT